MAGDVNEERSGGGMEVTEKTILEGKAWSDQKGEGAYLGCFRRGVPSRGSLCVLRDRRGAMVAEESYRPVGRRRGTRGGRGMGGERSRVGRGQVLAGWVSVDGGDGVGMGRSVASDGRRVGGRC